MTPVCHRCSRNTDHRRVCYWQQDHLYPQVESWTGQKRRSIFSEWGSKKSSLLNEVCGNVLTWRDVWGSRSVHVAAPLQGERRWPPGLQPVLHPQHLEEKLNLKHNSRWWLFEVSNITHVARRKNEKLPLFFTSSTKRTDDSLHDISSSSSSSLRMIISPLSPVVHIWIV